MPIVHLYSRNGFGGRANPGVENRVYFMAHYTPMKNLYVGFPLVLRNTKSRDFQTNGSWSHKVYIEPVVMYSLSKQLAVGVQYMSENLVASDFSELTIGKGLETGRTAFILRASL